MLKGAFRVVFLLVFSSGDAKKLRMVIFYNKQLKKPVVHREKGDKNLNFRGTGQVFRIRITNHQLDTPVKLRG